MALSRETYDYGHAGALGEGAEDEQGDGDHPALCAALDAARHDDDEGDEGAQLDDDAEGDEEADGAPHVAEGRVLDAVGGAREGNALARDGRAAAMEAVRVFARAILGGC